MPLCGVLSILKSLNLLNRYPSRTQSFDPIYGDDQDFFEYEPDNWDVIVSNPPFTKKRNYFERALSFNKPFALIMTNTWLNDSAPKQLFKEKELYFLMF